MNSLDKLFKIFKVNNEIDKIEINNAIKEFIENDRKRLLKKLSEVNCYEFDDVFEQVAISLTN